MRVGDDPTDPLGMPAQPVSDWQSSAHARRCTVLSALLPPPPTAPQQQRQHDAALQAAGVPPLFSDEAPSAAFVDLDLLRAAAAELRAAPYPPGTLHTYAVKACPLKGLLCVLREEGFGAEVRAVFAGPFRGFKMRFANVQGSRRQGGCHEARVGAAGFLV